MPAVQDSDGCNVVNGHSLLQDLQVIAGFVYFIQISGPSSDASVLGDFTLSLTCNAPATLTPTSVPTYVVGTPVPTRFPTYLVGTPVPTRFPTYLVETPVPTHVPTYVVGTPVPSYVQGKPGSKPAPHGYGKPTYNKPGPHSDTSYSAPQSDYYAPQSDHYASSLDEEDAAPHLAYYDDPGYRLRNLA
jgi:hypothetical protein